MYIWRSIGTCALPLAKFPLLTLVMNGTGGRTLKVARRVVSPPGAEA